MTSTGMQDDAARAECFVLFEVDGFSLNYAWALSPCRAVIETR
jgi:hypothetical protein